MPTQHLLKLYRVQGVARPEESLDSSQAFVDVEAFAIATAASATIDGLVYAGTPGQAKQLLVEHSPELAAYEHMMVAEEVDYAAGVVMTR